MNSLRARRIESLFLLLITLLSCGLRLYRLGSPSLAEDEAAKLLAITEYKQGHFAGVNSEHPMLMKLLAWGSLEIGQHWNRWAAAHRLPQPREEAWLRAPTALLGSATTIVLYLLGKQMLGLVGAGAAAFFWAVSPLSVGLNRVLKEETLFTFFTLFAFYLYNRGKNAMSERDAGRFFVLSGACFGMDLASSYLAVGQFGLIVLIWDVANRVGIKSRQMGPHFLRLVISGGVAFLLLNPVILSPVNLRAMTKYSEEKTLEHRGYLLDGKVLLNNALTTPYGLPWYFYFWVLGVKTPLPILAAAIAGVLLLFREQDSLISIFLRVTLVFWFVPYSLAGSKWIRYLLIILPSIYFAGGWAIEKLSGWLAGHLKLAARRAAVTVAGLVLFAWPTANILGWTPDNRLFVNALGGGRASAGKYFPPDEVYDLGVRDAVEYVCGIAPRGSTLAGSDPMALSFYIQQYGRSDIHIVPLFDPQYIPRPGDFLLVQESRRYFETEGLLELLARRGPPVKRIYVKEVLTASVYRF